MRWYGPENDAFHQFSNFVDVLSSPHHSLLTPFINFCSSLMSTLREMPMSLLFFEQ